MKKKVARNTCVLCVLTPSKQAASLMPLRERIMHLCTSLEPPSILYFGYGIRAGRRHPTEQRHVRVWKSGRRLFGKSETEEFFQQNSFQAD